MRREQVASTAKLRKRAVTERDFGKSSGRLFYLFNQAANDISPARKLALWNRFIPLTPRKAFQILSRGLPRDTSIVLDLRTGGKGEIIFESENRFRDDGSFDLKERLLDAGLVRVYGAHKGKGYGRTLFRNQIEFFRACGVKRFEIVASLENGGYSWARVGFLPDDLKGAEFRDDCLKPMRKNLRALRSLLSEKERGKLEKWLRLKDREDFWKLADAPVDLGPRLREVFNAAADDAPKKGRQKARTLVRRLSEHFDDELFTYMKERAEKGQSVNIGRLLLTGTSWIGSIDMDDPDQMRRVGKYTGGWRTLKIG